jgi:meso-butanediol dehydrogenase / (S,S)-butanediol dehydrogenase / diacetyl reductase
MRLEGRTALVTGGGSGIGAEIARRLAADGATVWVMGRRREPLARVSAHTVVGDIVVEADRARAVAECGDLDVLVNNAATGEGDWDTTLDVNLTAAHRLTELALPGLVRRKGAIVNVSSLGGLRAHAGSPQYGVSKAALIQLTRSQAVRLGPQGVRANAVCPGWVRTAMADQTMRDVFDPDTETGYERATRHVPLRRPGTPAEVAAAVAFLASPEAGYITAAVLTIDGGASVVDAGMLG